VISVQYRNEIIVENNAISHLFSYSFAVRFLPLQHQESSRLYSAEEIIDARITNVCACILILQANGAVQYQRRS